MCDLALALLYAIEVHADQRDKLGLPYLLHIKRVVESVTPEARCVAALHDTVEDGPHTVAEVALRLDLSVTEIEALGLVTRDPETTYADYIAQIACYPRLHAQCLAREVKLADLRDNLERLPSGVQWLSLRERYERAVERLSA